MPDRSLPDGPIARCHEAGLQERISSMGFIAAESLQPRLEDGVQVLIGPAEGATHLWLMRQRAGAGAGPAVHCHRGEELFRVLSGEVLFLIGEERRVCHAGDLAAVPPNAWHAFKGITDCEVEVIGELGMGQFLLVIDPDGRRREVELFASPREVKAYGGRHLWKRIRPPGTPELSREAFRSLVATTRHLL